MKLSFVSAGAGSGKTYRLTEIISSAMESGVRPERIVATTFTNKAADEIRERVTGAFIERGNMTMIQESPAITIGTVNSVCGQLLKRFAFEAGLSPQQRVIEVDEAASLLKVVMERNVSAEDREALLAIEERFGYEREAKDSWQGTALEIVAAARNNGIGPDGLRSMAARNVEDLLSCFHPALVDPEGELREALESAIPEMEARQREREVQKSGKYLDDCREFLRSLERGRWTWKQWIVLARGGYGKNCEEAGDRVRDVAVRYLGHPRLHADIKDYIGLCFRAASDSLEAFAAAKREAGLIDFVDQECLLHEALDREEVRHRLSSELGLLVVDEFQDTSPIQLAVFLKLARLAEECVWVGDVKQAIYGFRGSDARLMASIVGGLPELGGTMEILRKSWRSRPALVRLADAVFVPAFSGELGAEQVALEATREEYCDRPAFMHWILPGNQGEQAEELAAGILELEASGFPIMDKERKAVRPVEWRDIAVLTRTNAAADRARASLKRLGIPCEGGGSGTLSGPEWALLLACLRRLNDKGDSLASAEILALSEGLSPEDWLGERLDYVESRAGDQGLWRCAGEGANPILERIEELRPLALLLSPAELARGLAARCHLDRVAASWAADAAEAEKRIGRLDAILDLIAAYEEDPAAASGRSLSGLILWLKEKAENGDEGALARRGNGVQVLTYHSAKGLEWPVCVCCDTTSKVRDGAWGLGVRKSEGFSIERPLDGRRIRFWPWPFGDLKVVDGLDLDTNAGVGELRAEAEEEARRLLYVGLTRARDLLIQALPEKAQGGGILESLGAEACALLRPLEPGARNLALSSGEVIPYELKTLVPATERAAPPPPERRIEWYKPADEPLRALPAIVNPSAVGPEASAARERRLEVIRYRDGGLARGDMQARERGSIYHAFVAWTCSNPRSLDERGAVGAFLSRQAIGAFDAEGLAASVKALYAWIASTWPGCPVRAECPISVRLENGQISMGRMDLLVETPEGFVVIDHKLTEEAEDDVATVAEWVPQLKAYSGAISRATGRSVVGAWINLPFEGKLIRLADR